MIYEDSRVIGFKGSSVNNIFFTRLLDPSTTVIEGVGNLWR